MIPREKCRHLTLSFGSGDYYIFCNDCDAKWCAHNHTQSEYGYDKDGKPIGADPSVCNKGDHQYGKEYESS